MSKEIDWIGGLKVVGTVLGVGIVVYVGYTGVKWLQKKWPDIKSWWSGIWGKIKDPFGINDTLGDLTGGDTTLLPTGDSDNSIVGTLLSTTPAASVVNSVQLLTGGGLPDQMQLMPGVSLLTGGVKPRPTLPKPSSNIVGNVANTVTTGVSNIVSGLTGLLKGRKK